MGSNIIFKTKTDRIDYKRPLFEIPLRLNIPVMVMVMIDWKITFRMNMIVR
jgi:hypothetical protein